MWINWQEDTFPKCNLGISISNMGMSQRLPTVEPHLEREDSTFTINAIYFLRAWKLVSNMIRLNVIVDGLSCRGTQGWMVVWSDFGIHLVCWCAPRKAWGVTFRKNVLPQPFLKKTKRGSCLCSGGCCSGCPAKAASLRGRIQGRSCSYCGQKLCRSWTLGLRRGSSWGLRADYRDVHATVSLLKLG